MEAPSLAVIGAGGTQAGAMLEVLVKVIDPRTVLAIDRRWAPAARARLERLGVTVLTGDIVQDRANLVDRSMGARLVANLAGPAYVVAPAAFDYTLDLGADYLDITDDIDATAALLARGSEARAKGIAALIGMGSAPGMTNILCRLALDALGDAPDPRIDLACSVDAADLTPASLRHYFHCLATALPGRTGVPTWEELEPEQVDFGAPVGLLTALTLGHPEPLTLPRFTRVKTVTNKGAIAPNEVSYLMWLLARCTNYGVGEAELFR
ncbi:MAG: saccharopine dehydrogenase, partial [Gemmatimonadota bacterium]